MDSTKATPTGFKTYNRQYSTFVEYEYRGHKYEVEYPNDMSYCVTSPKVQHELAQATIDKMIEHENQEREVKYEDTGDYGFELFWRYVNEEDWLVRNVVRW